MEAPPRTTRSRMPAMRPPTPAWMAVRRRRSKLVPQLAELASVVEGEISSEGVTTAPVAASPELRRPISAPGLFGRRRHSSRKKNIVAVAAPTAAPIAAVKARDDSGPSRCSTPSMDSSSAMSPDVLVEEIGDEDSDHADDVSSRADASEAGSEWTTAGRWGEGEEMPRLHHTSSYASLTRVQAVMRGAIVRRRERTPDGGPRRPHVRAAAFAARNAHKGAVAAQAALYHPRESASAVLAMAKHALPTEDLQKQREKAEKVIYANIIKWRERKFEVKQRVVRRSRDGQPRRSAVGGSPSRHSRSPGRGSRHNSRSPGRERSPSSPGRRSGRAGRPLDDGFELDDACGGGEAWLEDSGRQPYASNGVFTEEELTFAHKLRSSWGKPPADNPDASCCCHRADVRCWRWKGDSGIDEYESEFDLPISVDSFMAMQTETTERIQWDAMTKKIEVLFTTGPAECSRLHNQAGDHMGLCWLQASPTFPFPAREFVLTRRVARLRPRAGKEVPADPASPELAPSGRSVAPPELEPLPPSAAAAAAAPSASAAAPSASAAAPSASAAPSAAAADAPSVATAPSASAAAPSASAAAPSAAVAPPAAAAATPSAAASPVAGGSARESSGREAAVSWTAGVGGDAKAYFRIDWADDKPESWALKPNVPKGAVRVTDHRHYNVAWERVHPVTGARSTRVRSRYREDPMTNMVPKFLIGLIMDKLLPRGLASLRKAAIEYERRALAAEAGATPTAPLSPRLKPSSPRLRPVSPRLSPRLSPPG